MIAVYEGGFILASRHSAYHKVAAFILKENPKPGDTIMHANRVAAELSISRTTASNALNQLKTDGWIESENGLDPTQPATKHYFITEEGRIRITWLVSQHRSIHFR